MPLVSKTVEVEAVRGVDHVDRRRLRGVSRVERGDQGLLGAGPLRRRPAQPAAARRGRPGAVGHLHHGGLLPEPEPRSTRCCSRATSSPSRSRSSRWCRWAPTSLLTVDLDVETKMAVPKTMVKKVIGDALDYLADNLKNRAEHRAELAIRVVIVAKARQCLLPRRRRLKSAPDAGFLEPRDQPPRAVGELPPVSATTSAMSRRRSAAISRRWLSTATLPTGGRGRRSAAACSAPRAAETTPA